MSRAKVQRPWLCRHHHPMWRSPRTGNWVCYTCNELNLNHAGAETAICKNGHKRQVGKVCRVCHGYRQSPWLQQLDADGSGVCPRGHAVSHHDGSIMYIRGKKSSRRCRSCQTEDFSKALALYPGKSTSDMCQKGLHPRTPENTKYNTRGEAQCAPCHRAATRASAEALNYAREAKKGLKATHVDWVVVERMLEHGTMDYIKRGSHRGPTDGERWVAYCTFVANAGGKHPEDLYGVTGYDAMRLFKFAAWREIGEKYKWKPVTLGEVRSIVHTPQYITGSYLRRGVKR